MKKHTAALQRYALFSLSLGLMAAVINLAFDRPGPSQPINWIIQFSNETPIQTHSSLFLAQLEQKAMTIHRFEAVAPKRKVWHLEGFLENGVDYQKFRNDVLNAEMILSLSENSRIDDRSSWTNDPYFSHQWQLNNSGAFGLPDVDTDAEDAWRITRGGTTAAGDTIVIAVIDNAVRRSHPDLSDNWWRNPQEQPNGIDDDGNGYVDDLHGWNFNTDKPDTSEEGRGDAHGTPVCGIIGASGCNAIGVSGICPQVKILPVVKGPDLLSLLQAHYYILDLRQRYNQSEGREGAFIVAVNASWGRDSLRAADHPLWCSLYEEMGAAGILFAAAAPNANVDIDQIGDMPADCSSDFLLSVTNSNHFDEKVLDAGYGAISVDLAAPGNNSFTTSNSGHYAYFGGCSAAAPYVSGAIGLLYSLPSAAFAEQAREQPAETALLVRRMLLEQVDRRPDFEGKTQSGGRLNVNQALLALAAHFNEPLPLPEPSASALVYPSPASGAFRVELELVETEPVSLSVWTMAGQQLAEREWGALEAGLHRLELRPEGWPAGILLLQLHISDQIQTIKLPYFPFF